MVKEIKYTSVRRVLDNLMDHPLLRDLTLEQVVRYTVRFIGIHSYPKFYQDKIEDVPIDKFRGLLPCDLISIIQVKDCKTGICMRAMTDSFPKGMKPVDIHEKYSGHKEPKRPHKDWYIPEPALPLGELTFKTQGRVIYTSFPKGVVEVAYKSMPIDDDGFPLLIDNENYLAALEAYIKKQVFTVKFDTGKVNSGVLQNAQQEYAWAAGQLQSEFTTPSTSEMEAITRQWNTLIPKVREFDNGFRNLGDREYIRRH